MRQQIKSDNKNNGLEVFKNLDQFRFQASVLSYVERKKKDISAFSPQSSIQKTIPSIYPPNSNLINKNTISNFYKLKHSNQSSDLQVFHVNLIDKTQKSPLVIKNKKRHKSTLCDWRDLYEERDNITEKQEMRRTCFNRMQVTDRLFYPSHKKEPSDFENQETRKNFSNLDRQIPAKEIKVSGRQTNKSQMQFISDQNYFHMYYRSNTPLFNVDGEGKRIVRYLNENKHKRQSSQGLRLMNEVVPDEQKTDIAIHINTSQFKKPYKKLSDKKYSFNVTSPNFLVQNRKKNAGPKQLSQYLNKKEKILLQKDSNKSDQVKECEAQFKHFITKRADKKKPINLAEICMKHLNHHNLKQKSPQIKLKYFKPKRNKIEKGIINLKNSIPEEKQIGQLQSFIRIVQ